MGRGVVPPLAKRKPLHASGVSVSPPWCVVGGGREGLETVAVLTRSMARLLLPARALRSLRAGSNEPYSNVQSKNTQITVFSQYIIIIKSKIELFNKYFIYLM